MNHFKSGQPLAVFKARERGSSEASLAKDRVKRAAKAAKRRRVRAAIARGFRVPRGEKKLFVIQAAVEVRTKHELAEVIQGVNLVLCPVDPHVDHECARRGWSSGIPPKPRRSESGSPF